MPGIACGISRVFGGLNGENFWIAAITVLHWVDVQGAEFARKGFVLFSINVLLAEHQHLPVQPRLIDLAELLVAQRLA